jgi:putative DNA primase/helicase
MCESEANAPLGSFSGGSAVKKARISAPTSRITIKGLGLDEWGIRYFKLAVKGSDVDLPPFSTQEIMKDTTGLFVELTNAGASAFQPSPRRELLRQLDEFQSQPAKFKVVSRLGWNSGAFVLPDKIIGQPSATLESSFRHLDQQLLAKYRAKGTLQEWQNNIGRLCSGNSRLMFCASLGLTGPILPLVTGPRSGGFQLFGSPESGKTGAAMVTGSIWGCHLLPERRENGFAESWHTTAGKVEITALAHNETVLILDETKRAGGNDKDRAKAVLESSFGLAENVEKERLTNLGSVRGWRFYFLSTSNYSLNDLAHGASIEIDDAERGRFVDIPNPDGGHGIYQDLHQIANGRKFTDSLKIRCRKFCGVVGPAFVRRLVADRAKDSEQLRKFLKRERAAYLQAIKTQAQTEKSTPLNRASGRFATVFAAGSLAIKYGIFRWDRQSLLQAILSCQLDGLRHSKVADEQADTSVAGLRRKLVEYLRNRRGKFKDLDKAMPRRLGLGKHTFGSVPGYKATFKGEKWYYLTSDQLKAIIGTGKNAKGLKNELATEGLMARRSTGEYNVQRPIFSGKGNEGYEWVHAFRAKAPNKRADD